MRSWMKIVESFQPQYVYVTQCSNGGHGNMGEAITDMVERGQDISYEEFMSCVGVEQMRDVFPSYDWSGKGQGLTMKGDYAMKEAFYRSSWYGLDCVFCVWSRIEFIFTKNGQTPESAGINRREYLGQLLNDEYGSQTYWHVTLTSALPDITKNGLVPSVRDRSTKMGESHPRVYLFQERDDAEDAVMGWLGEEHPDENIKLALLRICLLYTSPSPRDRG